MENELIIDFFTATGISIISRVNLPSNNVLPNLGMTYRLLCFLEDFFFCAWSNKALSVYASVQCMKNYFCGGIALYLPLNRPLNICIYIYTHITQSRWM